MHISARIDNQQHQHSVTLSSGGREHSITIAPKAEGFGSSANGAELLMLALATCYCNDIYREAAKRNINVSRVEVQAVSDFVSEGEPLQNIRYNATVYADAPDDQILELMRHTDTVAEIHNTLRSASTVILQHGIAETEL